jgi:hypothetical protein
MSPKSFPVFVIKFTCIVSALFGLLALAASHRSFDGPWALLFDAIRWPLDGKQGQFSTEARVLNAVLGGIMVAWSLLLYWLIRGPIPNQVPGAKRAYVSSVALWFILDTGGSLAAGWVQNAALNLVFLAGLLLPLLINSGGGAIEP